MTVFKNSASICTSFWLGFIVAAVNTTAMAEDHFVGEDADFCAQAQRLIAKTDVAARNIVHAEYEAFVESKTVAYPLETQQFYSNPLGGDAGVSKVVSCKMRTAGSIGDAYADAGVDFSVGEDTSCDFVVTAMLSDVGDEIHQADRALKFTGGKVDEEQLTFMGPMWLDPWPFEPAYQDSSGTLHLRSRALYVPWSIFIPAPAAFKGVYYCHLPAPAYLRALLSGDARPPVGE